MSRNLVSAIVVCALIGVAVGALVWMMDTAVAHDDAVRAARPADVYTLALPDGRSVVCVEAWGGYAGGAGLDCDWEHAR